MEVKCKEHPFELGTGVCAACLRSRLTVIIAAQQSASASAISPTSQSQPSSSSNNNHYQHGHRNHHQPFFPPGAADFPRSASPTVSHRRRSFDESVFPHNQPHPLFYSTPQVAPRPAAAAAGSGRRRFAVIKSLFRVDKDREKHHPEHGSGPDDTSFPAATEHHAPSATASAPASSWFTALIPRLGRSGRGHRHRDPEADSTELPYTQNPFSSSPARRAPPQTPARPAASHQQKTTATSGFSMCLSPLVRASPGHRRNQVVSGEIGISGELNPCGRRRGRLQQDGTAALGPNRSRKLVDIGRRH